MTPLKKAALWIGIPVVLAAMAGVAKKRYFKPEINEILPRPNFGGYWVQAGAVRLYVPAGYRAKLLPNGRGAELSKEPGNVSAEMYLQEKVREGRMNFSFQHEWMSSLGAKRMREVIGQRFTEKSFHHVSERARSLAGKDGTCSEYSIRYGGEITYGTRLGIVCTFGQEGYADFEGTLPSAADFYQIIESAQPLKRKN